jgi:hypothetical protein
VGVQRELAAQNPGVYRPDFGRMLGNLGLLYRETGRFADAEAALREAAGIERELAAQNPAVYRPYLVRTLNNLASLYRDMHRDSDAKAVEPRRWTRQSSAPGGGVNCRVLVDGLASLGRPLHGRGKG